MVSDHIKMPWVSFCMSTYKRPVFLKQQLQIILNQNFKDFEVVICDNDPECSARSVVSLFDDIRLKYHPNYENIGMIKSFNRSIGNSTAEYIVMITDDDPIVPDMLQIFHELIKKFPGYGIYSGCSRKGKNENTIEIFDNENFLFQILNPELTTNLLWSSCVIKKSVLLSIGKIPDYGSPHLADHAMLALCGTVNGGLIINKMYSEIVSHENNFSKGNIDLYFVACHQFFDLITKVGNKNFYEKNGNNILIKHLNRWFIVAIFSLRKYYTYSNKKNEIIKQLDQETEKILALDYMKQLRPRYYLKLLIFNIKRPLYQYKILH